jgi:ATP-dependent exoDNAse (exonuclease V) beta subunit
VEREKPSIAHALRSAGVLPSEMEDATSRVAAALVATLADEHGRRILGAGSEARSEWAMMRYRDRRLTTAAVDRTFVHDGVRWIVDFKTGRLGDEEGEGDPIARKREQYTPQLSTYRDLVSAHSGAGAKLPIRLALFFPEWPEGTRWQPIADS